jgi:hypothetical protein
MDPENDLDGDLICGDVDFCPRDPLNDPDGDGVCDDVDNCVGAGPENFNPEQFDTDFNGVGDSCQINEKEFTCSDGLDNDGDGRVDHLTDPGCSDATDDTETDPSLPCDDGIDNDADSLIDFRVDGLGDPGCGGDASQPENPECNDGQDNDGDGFVDWDGYYGMYPPDPECQGYGFPNDEAVPEPSVGIGLFAGFSAIAFVSRRRARRLNALGTSR